MRILEFDWLVKDLTTDTLASVKGYPTVWWGGVKLGSRVTGFSEASIDSRSQGHGFSACNQQDSFQWGSGYRQLDGGSSEQFQF